MIDSEHDGFAEFSDLYVHLLRAALDEAHWSLSPRIRDRRLAAHVAREFSVTCMAHRALRSRNSFNQESGNAEEPLL
jgi:hypothetical protein